MTRRGVDAAMLAEIDQARSESEATIDAYVAAAVEGLGGLDASLITVVIAQELVDRATPWVIAGMLASMIVREAQRRVGGDIP